MTSVFAEEAKFFLRRESREHMRTCGRSNGLTNKQQSSEVMLEDAAFKPKGVRISVEPCECPSRIFSVSYYGIPYSVQKYGIIEHLTYQNHVTNAALTFLVFRQMEYLKIFQF